MTSESKTIIKDIRESDQHEAREYDGDATLRIKLPEDTRSDSMLHRVKIDLSISEQKKAINLKNFPEIDLGGGHIVIPLYFKDVEFIVQEDLKDCPKVEIKALVHRTVRPRVLDNNNVHVQDKVTQLTSVPTWCTIPHKAIPKGARLHISLSTKVTDKAIVRPLLGLIQKHHGDHTEISHQVNIIANDMAESLTVSGSVGNELCRGTHAVFENIVSFGSVDTNISQGFSHEILQNKSLSNFSPELITVGTSPTRPSIDLSKDDLAVLSGVGTFGLICQTDFRKDNGTKSIPNANVMRYGRRNDGKLVEERTQGRARGPSGRRLSGRGLFSGRQHRHHSSGNRSFARGTYTTPRGEYTQNPHGYPRSVAAPALAIDIDAQRQQSRVSKDVFWAEKAAKSRWKLNDRIGFGVMPASTKQASAPPTRDVVYEKSSHQTPSDAHMDNLPVPDTTAWTKFASDAARRKSLGSPSNVANKPAVDEFLTIAPTPKLRRGGALFVST